jgi:hypothetical protein
MARCSHALITFALTGLALVAFAANSILTRLALGHAEIGAATFTAVRLAAGALVLAVIVRAQSGSLPGYEATGSAVRSLYFSPSTCFGRNGRILSSPRKSTTLASARTTLPEYETTLVQGDQCV